MAPPHVTRVTATTLTPFHYHSLAVQSGTATLAAYLADRSMSYALAGAMGALAASAALPKKDYRRDLERLPWLASMFETKTPRLMKPLGRRLNLDGEGGYQKRIMDATSSGNLKTWFYIQEVPQDVVYEGAFFGPNPFELAGVEQLILRTGRHLSGLLRVEPSSSSGGIRLNAWTADLFGDATDDLEIDYFALQDIQVTIEMRQEEAAARVARWRSFGS